MIVRKPSIWVFIALALAICLPLHQLCSQEVVYRDGDWLKYRLAVSGKANSAQFNCTFVLYVNIVLATQMFATLSYNISMVSGDHGICLALFDRYSKIFNTTETIYTAVQKPENTTFLVNSSYTGEYKLDTVKVRYFRGVLVSLYSNVSAEDFVGTVSLELVDTSIDELKPQGGTQQPAYASIIAISIAISATSIAFIVFAIIRLRRSSAAHAQGIER